MLTNITNFSRLIMAGLLLTIILGCAGGPTQQNSFHAVTDADKYYRDASDQWVDYGF